MFFLSLLILNHAYTLPVKFQLIWVWFGWVQNGSSLNLIQTWIIFLPLKIAKPIHLKCAYFQDSTHIFLSVEFHSCPSILFLQAFSVLENEKGKNVEREREPSASAQPWSSAPLTPSVAAHPAHQQQRPCSSSSLLYGSASSTSTSAAGLIWRPGQPTYLL